jgi:hypothetical protein
MNYVIAAPFQFFSYGSFSNTGDAFDQVVLSAHCNPHINIPTRHNHIIVARAKAFETR